jgi:hypothetical protein
MLKKMMMFAASLASRGLNSKKIDENTKQLRVLSCFGHDTIEPCQYLYESNAKGRHYCGKCGCGDKPTTWLIRESSSYSKLDYPVLHCPLMMPGFSNYDPNFYEQNTKDRKQKIEDFDPENLKYIKITIRNSPI